VRPPETHSPANQGAGGVVQIRRSVCVCVCLGDVVQRARSVDGDFGTQALIKVDLPHQIPKPTQKRALFSNH
jgi:hypothetical protein